MICDSNRESQITSDLKGSALRFGCDLEKASNHKSRDLNCDVKRFDSDFGGYSCDIWTPRFEITSEFAICDSEHLAFEAKKEPQRMMREKPEHL